MAKGRIIKIIGGKFTVQDDVTKEKFVCDCAGKLRNVTVDKNSSFNKQVTNKKKLESKVIKLTPKVGDYCEYDIEVHPIINDIFPRENEMIRPLISNVDQILLIFAAKKPDFSYLLLDQFLVLLEQANIHAKIIISKIDLMTDKELKELKDGLNYYEKIGYEVFYVDSINDKGFDEVKLLFKDKVSVLSGQTGAGKSTFINTLIPGFKLQTQEISHALNRGKHTTRHSELYDFLGGLVGDTPGFSKLDFSLIEKDEMKDYFVEFHDFNCKYRGCLHDKEDDCAVKKACNDGVILKSRYENYVKFINDLKNIKKVY